MTVEGAVLRLVRAATFILASITLGLAAAALSACGPGGAPAVAPLEDQLLEPGPLGEREYGNPNAAVTVIEYVSLTCPHCRAYHANVF
ncbi:MAG: thioredoxin domain-containing protein, partial [Pseudomonadota bacterium]